MSLDVKVGDTVIIAGSGRQKPFEATIMRVGRKLAYIHEYHREVGFYIDNGAERSDYISRQMFTPEAYAERNLRNAAVEAVRKHTRDYNWVNRVSVEALEAIADIMERELAVKS